MKYTASAIVAQARKELGYLEKKTNAKLNDKTANAGSNNWTKYNKYFGYSNVYWCANFFCWLFAVIFGKEAGKKVLCGSYSASCETLRQQFIKAKRYSDTPKVGDAIFFKGTRHAGANHIGLVIKVTSSRVYTIEGNTSGGSSVVDNGGGVAEKCYSRGYDKILGYGHPKYDAETATETKKETTATVASPTLKKGNSGAGVKLLQKNLNKVLSYGLGTDGVFGDKTYNAVVKFQKKYGLSADGIYGEKTYKKMKSLIK